jgi:hypothetical protein
VLILLFLHLIVNQSSASQCGDGLNFAVGAVLGQRVGNLPHVIYYASKTMMDAQVNYTTTQKELPVDPMDTVVARI